MQEPLGLTEWQVEEETERQCGFDGNVGVPLLPSASAYAQGLPCGDRRGGQPQGDVAASDEGTIVGGPVRDAVLGLVRGMDSRIHHFSVVAAPRTSSDPNLAFSWRGIHAPTPSEDSEALQRARDEWKATD
jgi:hypothetical protein